MLPAVADDHMDIDYAEQLPLATDSMLLDITRAGNTLVAVGGLGGLLGGFVGVPGPPVIIMYMASTKSIAVIRANFLLYLLGIDILMLIIFIFSDLLNPTAVFVGLLMTPIYIIANAIGAYFFNPNAEVVFRRLAYLVISTSAISGLLM